MGFKAKATILKLKFVDDEYEGLEIRAKSPSMGAFLEIAELADVDVTSADADDVAAVLKLFEHFVNSVKDWNLEDDDGEPVPTTVDGLKTLDINFVMDVIGAWMDGVKGMSPGLPPPSESGPPSQEASIPMEALSPSPESSLVPVSS